MLIVGCSGPMFSVFVAAWPAKQQPTKQRKTKDA